MTRHQAILVSWVLLLTTWSVVAAAPGTAPPAGLRETSQRVHAIVGARIVVSPERTIEKGTLVMRDGVIVAVGENVTPPADAQIWKVDGKTLYPGLIDAFSELPRSAVAAAESAGAGYWNRHIIPQTKAHLLYASDASLNRKLREQGITTRLVAPSTGIIKGTSALVSTADDSGKQVILKEQVALHVRLTVARGSEGYPNSPMGALTLVRQAFYDAGWYGQAWDAYHQHPELSRPERSDALAVLRDYLGHTPPVIIDSSDELYFLRAHRIGQEFELNVIVRGSGEEYQRLDAIKATGRPVIVPLNFPKPPNVATPEAAMNVSLERLMHWDLAPENPARLAAAGVKIVLTSHGLSGPDAFLPAVRKAVKRGLPPDAALKALTTTAAQLFGAADRLGTLEPGKAANMLLASGELFDTKTKVLETWVDGQRFEIETEPATDLRGSWNFDVSQPDGQATTLAIELSGSPKKLSGKIARGDKSTSLISPALNDLQFTASFKGEPIGHSGVVQLSATISQSPPADATIAPPSDSALGAITWADGKRSNVTAKRTAGPKSGKSDEADPKVEADPKKTADNKDAPQQNDAPPKDAATNGQPDKANDPAAKPKTGEEKTEKTETPAKKEPGAPEKESTPKVKKTDTPASAISTVNFPFGDFGRAAPPEQPRLVLFRGAAVWTSGPQGCLKADVLVESGKIRQVAPAIPAPEGALVIDATNKHITPGIIDCHSHVATDGGVNESAQTITAEVRIGDFVDPNDINIYRQIAGGVTSSNILHGSANTIGGQNQVLKFRWGALPEEMKFAAAPQGIKFALGENVKQSNRSERAGGRYPQTRMGVEQLVRDAFRAAQQYRQRHDQWNRTKTGLPPRIDLELEALAEVVEGKRLIHCHSYRQDEILALMRTCEDFKIRIATFQHILEGYKVADVMARHGVGGSSFSDWWAYKFEVWDAIPYNGALLHNAGVVVSFNSDNAELARRLNLEAAKAVKYGGVDPLEALKFVTLNPAKQLRIDTHVGSLEPGKDADLVVWNGSPLSTYSRVEQTWIDGRRYFEIEEDAAARQQAATLHARLVQRVLGAGEPTEGPDDNKKDQWPREDEFCEHGDEHDHVH